MAIPKDSTARKNTPVFSGLLDYFPDACALVSQLSYEANEKHNPGEPMHWSKHKSNDHRDCVVRHLMTQMDRDEFGFLHAVAAAWRAMANLQVLIDEGHEGRLVEEPPVEVADPISPTDHTFEIVNPIDMGLGGELQGARVYGQRRHQFTYQRWHVKGVYNGRSYDFQIWPADVEKGYVEIID